MFGNKREQESRRGRLICWPAQRTEGRELEGKLGSEPRWWWPGRVRGWLSTQKDAIATIQAVATVLALGVGALWTWWLFDPVAQRVPNLYVTQSAETRKLGQGLLLLHVTFVLENTGRTTAFLTCAALIVSRVVPANDQELKRLSGDVRDVLKTPSPNWQVLKWEVDDSLAPTISSWKLEIIPSTPLISFCQI